MSTLTQTPLSVSGAPRLRPGGGFLPPHFTPHVPSLEGWQCWGSVCGRTPAGRGLPADGGASRSFVSWHRARALSAPPGVGRGLLAGQACGTGWSVISGGWAGKEPGVVSRRVGFQFWRRVLSAACEGRPLRAARGGGAAPAQGEAAAGGRWLPHPSPLVSSAGPGGHGGPPLGDHLS